MRQSPIALGAATFRLAACGGTTEERAATGGLGGAAAGAVVGGPVGAIVGDAVMDEGVDEKIGGATASEATTSGADVLRAIKGWDEFSTILATRRPRDGGLLTSMPSRYQPRRVACDR